MRLSGSRNFVEFVAYAQAVLYVTTGVWPLVHMPSFIAVTGHESKPDPALWLVKTVGVLITVIGGVIAAAAAKRRITAEIVGLAVAAALALTAVDVIYALNGTISKIYLLDAAAEVALVLAWLATWPQRQVES